MIKKQLKGVIFDMDGVIVDSMPYHFLAWYEVLRPWGVRVSCLDVYLKEGERWDKTLISLLKDARIRPSKATLKRIFLARQKIFKKYFKRFIFKGAKGFLRCLKRKGYLLGLVTGTPEKEIHKILPPGIKNLFDIVIPGNAVKHGKPHPEPYLKACLGLHLKPYECAVIENAPLGIKSAKAAGMYCIALTTSLPAPYLKGADRVADSLEEVTGIIERTCRV